MVTLCNEGLIVPELLLKNVRYRTNLQILKQYSMLKMPEFKALDDEVDRYLCALNQHIENVYSYNNYVQITYSKAAFFVKLNLINTLNSEDVYPRLDVH